MKELTLDTLLAVFEDMFGKGMFWAMVALAGLITLGYLYVLIRDRRMSMRKFLWAQLSMPVGAVLAVAFVLGMTNSGFEHMGGPIDVVVLAGVALLGAVGFAILVYVAQSLARGPQLPN
ncbi:MAG: DUF5368 domain-containing protein [Rhizobiaceae bacterium]|jgi:hypothetical protein|nr:DUF5368 domain-containing protein [Rhizobiaceae bacterium]